jgi:replication factor C subunit 1
MSATPIPICITGRYNKDSIDGKKYTVHKVLKPGSKLLCGTVCNDGRPITESWRYKQAVKLGLPIVRRRPTPTIATDEPPHRTPLEVKKMLVDKYAPNTLDDVIGHKEQIANLRHWLNNWTVGGGGVLCIGPPGIGKTTVTHLVAKSLGYAVSEYNASDTRSVSVLRGLFALGVRRLRKEVIIMDEVDGLSERGGVGEIAEIIRKSATPIICIANEKPPKLKPIAGVCLEIKFSRPVKGTIANGLLKVAAGEGLDIKKAELEKMCEESGNDIRAILNTLEFYGGDCGNDGGGKKDATLRLDAFSATQKLFANKSADYNTASNLVFVDYGMIPLMVSEAYVAAGKDSLDDIVRAAELVSAGDIMDRRIHQRHDWGLLPHYVANVVSTTKAVKGYAPFQIFPQWLGKNSKRLKHRRWINDLSQKMRCGTSEGMRLDYVDSLQKILCAGLMKDKPDIKGVIMSLNELGFTRDDLFEAIGDVIFDGIEIPTKVKTAFTREYNKTHGGVKKSIIVKDKDKDKEDDEELEIEDTDTDTDTEEICDLDA